ncbi:MAG: hypothetical protein RLZZ479_722 [Bacteroidota bacterium]|jgi:hypothetical protein
MKHIYNFDKYLAENGKHAEINEGKNNKAKYVWWKLYSRDKRNIESCSITFYNELKYNSSIAWPMELHYPKLFTEERGKFKRTQLALDLGVVPPSSSFSLTCGLEKKIPEFLQFWEDEGYIMVYEEPLMNAKLYEDYIEKNKLVKFTKERM